MAHLLVEQGGDGITNAICQLRTDGRITIEDAAYGSERNPGLIGNRLDGDFHVDTVSLLYFHETIFISVKTPGG